MAESPFSHVENIAGNRWEEHYKEIVDFIKTHGHRPSKYAAEERQMLNWIKYNRKLISHGQLSAQRAERFAILEQLLKEKRRINQYAFVYSQEGELFSE